VDGSRYPSHVIVIVGDYSSEKLMSAGVFRVTSLGQISLRTQKEWKFAAHPSIEYRVIDSTIAEEWREGTRVYSSFEQPIYIVKFVSDRTSFLFRLNVLK
jgi:hypothetical protein